MRTNPLFVLLLWVVFLNLCIATVIETYWAIANCILPNPGHLVKPLATFPNPGNLAKTLATLPNL